MKKLLGVSIAAMLAVTPMIASADGKTPTAATDAAATNNPFVGVAVDNEAHIATTSYVQGAYNAAIGAINEVATTAGAAQTVNQVKEAIGNAAGDGLSGNTTNGTLELDVAADKAIQLTGATAGSKELDLVLADGTLTQNSSGLKVGTITDSNINDGTISQSKINGLGTALDGKQDQLTNGSVNISANVATTMNTNIDGTSANQARDDVLVTEKAVATALAAIKTLADDAQTAQEVEDKIDAAAGDGLATNGLGVLSVTAGDGIQVADDKVAAKLHTGGGLDIDSTSKGIKVVVDGSTIENSNGTLQVKSGVYDISGAASTAKSDIETKLGVGASGYDINAKSLKVQGSDVSTETGVTATISNSTVPVYTTWGSSDATTVADVYVKSAAYTVTARENGVAAN